jgi:hypothetical protein
VTPEDLQSARDYVRAKARFACGGAKGRGKLDPVYVEVTQGRDSKANWAHYSSCGDQLHWMAWELGVRDPWVNRDDPDSNRHWRPGTNITDLEKPATAVPISYVPEAGDLLLLWNTGNDAHVCIAGTTEAGVLEVMNYGAGGMCAVEFPGSNISHLHVIKQHGSLFVQNPTTRAVKQVQRVITLPNLLALSSGLPSMTSDDTAALIGATT